MIAHTIVQACTSMHTFPHIQMHIYLAKNGNYCKIHQQKQMVLLWISLQGIVLHLIWLTCLKKVMAFPRYHDPNFLEQHRPNQGDDHGFLMTPNLLVLSEHLREKSSTSEGVYMLAEELFQGYFASDTKQKN